MELILITCALETRQHSTCANVGGMETEGRHSRENGIDTHHMRTRLDSTALVLTIWQETCVIVVKWATEIRGEQVLDCTPEHVLLTTT